MKFAITTILAAAVISCTAQANDLSDCARTDADLDRLACYDRASGRTPTTEVVTSKDSEWVVNITKSKFTDQTNVALTVFSEEPMKCDWGRGRKAALVIRCLENRTAMYFNTGCHMVSGDYTTLDEVDLRIDDKPMRTLRMTESNDHKALGLWRGSTSIPVIKYLFGGSRLLARMTPYSGSPFTVTFNITGLTDAIVPLRESCGWSVARERARAQEKARLKKERAQEGRPGIGMRGRSWGGTERERLEEFCTEVPQSDLCRGL